MKISNKKNLAVLLATYNASKFLREQLDSLLAQTYTEWICYCQDDGSKDDTVEILAEYERKYPSYFKLIDVGLTRQGCANNFMSLLNCIESDYYMFCDQDDVWLPNKLKISIETIKEYEQKYNNIPLLIHTDRTFVDTKLNVLIPSEWNPKGKRREKIEKKIINLHNVNILSIYNICAGNTMCFNRMVKKLCFPYLNIRVHDSIVSMAIANSKMGKIIAIHEPTVLYRLHEGQTCGVKNQSITRKLLSLNSVIRGNFKAYHIWALYDRGSFLKFLYWRFMYFFILRMN